jgi:hypothetical protein
MTTCVLVSEDEGNISDVKINIKGNDLYRILKGPATFIGQWPEIDVVIMRCRESVFSLLDNRNVLPPPFSDEKVLGPILLIRMDENSDPQDFTVSEYLEFLNRHPGAAV